MYVLLLTFRVRSYAVVHQLQIRPTVHYGAPLPFPKLQPGPCSSVGMWRGTDTQTQTRITNVHFASSTTRAKCNNIDAGHLRAIFIPNISSKKIGAATYRFMYLIQLACGPMPNVMATLPLLECRAVKRCQKCQYSRTQDLDATWILHLAKFN